MQTFLKLENRKGSTKINPIIEKFYYSKLNCVEVNHEIIKSQP